MPERRPRSMPAGGQACLAGAAIAALDLPGLPRRGQLASAVGAAIGATPPPALVLLSIVSIQIGAALAVHLFPALGPAGTVLLRVGLAALLRLSPRTYGVLVTLEPAVAVLTGAVLLAQPAGARTLLAVSCVMAAAIGVTWSDRRGPDF